MRDLSLIFAFVCLFNPIPGCWYNFGDSLLTVGKKKNKEDGH